MADMDPDPVLRFVRAATLLAAHKRAQAEGGELLLAIAAASSRSPALTA